jgi:hypothetical protein
MHQLSAIALIVPLHPKGGVASNATLQLGAAKGQTKLLGSVLN